MAIEEPIAKPAVFVSRNQFGKVAGAVRIMALEYFARAREHNTAFLFTSASMLVTFCSMFAGVLVVRWVSAKDLGIWRVALLAVPYSMISLAGVNNGLSRELPYFLGRSDERTARQLAATTLFYISGASMLVLLGGIGALLFSHDRGSKFLFAIAAVTVLIILTFYSNYFIVTFRSAKSFRDFSKIKLAEAFLTLATIPLLYYLGYNGLLLRVVVLSGLVLGLMHLFRPISVAPNWNWKSFTLLLKTGMPIFILDYVYTFAGSCDRLVLLKLGGFEAVGYYYVASMARDAMGIIPGALSEYIYPRMNHSYGKYHDPIRLWNMVVKSSLMVIAFMTPAVVAGWFILPPAVLKLFPKYTEGIRAAQWLLVASVFSGLMLLGRMALISMKSWRLATWHQILGASLMVAGPVIGGLCGTAPLIGVSVGSCIGAAAWFSTGLYLVYLATHRPHKI